MCECCNSDAEHELALTGQMAYWRAQLGDGPAREVENERLLRLDGIIIGDDWREVAEMIQRRLK